MNKEQAAQIVDSYLSRIFAYTKKRISNPTDAEDVSQEIAIRVYRALCVKEVEHIDAFIWTAARNTIINFYRKSAKNSQNISYDAMQMDIGELAHPEEKDLPDQLIEREMSDKIRSEIAYLSEMQRKILVLYYYDEKKQSEIAEYLRIPLGTVKWHLNAAKKNLREGMMKMREVQDLKFAPIEFDNVYLSGSAGTVGGARNFVRSALSQNILYCIRNQYRSIAEIADLLGVSPVYVESELKFLEKYQIVLRTKDRYISNILIEEPTAGQLLEEQELYEKVSGKMAAGLFDEILQSGLLQSDEILGPDDTNFKMWSLVFYLLATVESNDFSPNISFEQAATIRTDGGTNIITADVKNDAPCEAERILGSSIGHLSEKWSGPCWNSDEHITLWLMDGEWSDKRIDEYYGGSYIRQDLKLLKRFLDGDTLSVDEYTFMLEKGYIAKENGQFVPAIVILKEGKTKKELCDIARKVKSNVLKEEEEAIEAYRQKLLKESDYPKHLKIQQEFVLQYLFHSDGIFMIYAKQALVDSGRLKRVDEGQRKSVTQMAVVR